MVLKILKLEDTLSHSISWMIIIQKNYDDEFVYNYVTKVINVTIIHRPQGCSHDQRKI